MPIFLQLIICAYVVFWFARSTCYAQSIKPILWLSSLLKGQLVYSQKIFFKYVMLRTVTNNSTIIITKYTWYYRYREIIQINGGPPLRLLRKPDSKAGRRKLKCSDVTWALSRLTRIIISLERVYHSWRNFSKIMPFGSSFTCFCTGSTDFRSTGYAQLTSAFRSFWSLSSFKIAAHTGH